MKNSEYMRSYMRERRARERASLTRCAAIVRGNDQCRRMALPDGTLCKLHARLMAAS